MPGVRVPFGSDQMLALKQLHSKKTAHYDSIKARKVRKIPYQGLFPKADSTLTTLLEGLTAHASQKEWEWPHIFYICPKN